MNTTLQQQMDKMKRKLERQQRILKLRAQGKTMREIGEIEGLSHQRVDQIIKMAEQDRQGRRA